MAEFNGKQGRWVTIEGRHLFIENGVDVKDAIKNWNNGKKYADAPKVRRDIGNRLAKSYDACKDELREIFDYIKKDPERQSEFIKTLRDLPYSNQETVLDAEIAFKKNDPEKVYHGAYTSMPQFIRAYAKMTEPGISNKELTELPLSDIFKKHSVDMVDKQSKEIEAREKETKALNEEKKANDTAKEYQTKKNALVDKYRKELRNELKKNDGKMPRKINMPTTTEGRDAVLSAIDAEYNLSPAEDKIWDTIQVQNRNGVPYLWLPGKAPVSTLGLSQKGVAGLRKWLSVWGAENL